MYQTRLLIHTQTHKLVNHEALLRMHIKQNNNVITVTVIIQNDRDICMQTTCPKSIYECGTMSCQNSCGSNVLTI